MAVDFSVSFWLVLVSNDREKWIFYTGMWWLVAEGEIRSKKVCVG